MQGRNSDMITFQYEMEGFLLKIDYWVHQLRMHQFDAFPLLKAHFASYPPDAYSLDLFTTHLSEMKVLIREYFPPLREYENEWVISPFNAVVVHNAQMETNLQHQLFGLSVNLRMKAEYSTRTVSQFWVSLKDKYPQLSSQAMRSLMPFPTSYLCELGFSTVKFLKNEYRNRLQNIESDLMLAINSNIQPNIERLVNEK
ncbi:zinc finger BED domain-containing protein 5-like [Belonocnema kinseyi]|uniref:zinc finger BED domain-containing protein 5-like n=1 Tax=Belonocnema kinseyi TaxID=2817044 RepID=UPI00143CF431|nr:zinc finger BED domain-containing protein 5-like [Belonocnema kinseyi]